MGKEFVVKPDDWISYEYYGQFERFLIASLFTFFSAFPQHFNFSLSLTIEGDNEFYTSAGKTGLGSSASSTVSLIKTLLNLFGISESYAFKLASIAHSIAQNSIGSCFDISCAVYGTQIYKCPTKQFVSIEKIHEDWDFEAQKICNQNLFVHLISTGFDGSSTPSLVKLFRAGIIPDLYEKYKEAALQAIDAFSTGNQLGEKLKKVRAVQREITLKCNCPIVPDEVEDLAQKVETISGVIAVVVPGAGGFDSIAALTNTEEVDFSSMNLTVLTHTVCI